MVSPTTGPTGDDESPSCRDGSYDLAIRMQRQHQHNCQWDEEAQNMSAEASFISQRLVTIRSQLVTISDKTSSAASAAGNDVTEEEMQMAVEAQNIMKRLGEIKARLSKKKKKLSQSPLVNTSNSSSLGLASITEAGHEEMLVEGSFPVLNRPFSVLPSAVSLGTTPCLSSSFSTHQGFLNVTPVPSSSASTVQELVRAATPISKSPEGGNQLKPQLSTEERDGAPSSLSDTEATSMDFTPPKGDSPDLPPEGQFFYSKSGAFLYPPIHNISRSSTLSDSFITGEDDSKVFPFEHQSLKVSPWGRGTPGRLDHGIGVIVKPLRSMPSLEPIVSLDTSSSSELSPIPPADDTSVNAFDYDLTKHQCPVTAAGVTPSLLDDTLLDTSSIEDPFEASKQDNVIGAIENSDGTASRSSTKSFSFPSTSCEEGSIMDLFACGSKDVDYLHDPSLGTPGRKSTLKDKQNACCNDKVAPCDHPLGQDYYSVGAFLRSLRYHGAWTG
ncbi:hypothetical protein IV203_026201 [Nitzschia inconspicua]|uniref:Uncharacterized protein n=1 Tax=Nitzschia inconspicua TaxID=303405 RepID=A0A9K3LL83_9STRA|nr:hypothetical protein IV203_026201 [Nitzschia inconspicua]